VVYSISKKVLLNDSVNLPGLAKSLMLLNVMNVLLHVLSKVEGQRLECQNKEKKDSDNSFDKYHYAQQPCLRNSDFEKSYEVRERLASPC